ncbi:MAG: hypothetical protein ACE5H5_05115 [Nitrospinota bacterium]
MPELTRRVRPPRALAVPFGGGRPFGPPAHPDVREAVLARALELVATLEAPGTLVDESAPTLGSVER